MPRESRTRSAQRDRPLVTQPGDALSRRGVRPEQAREADLAAREGVDDERLRLCRRHVHRHAPGVGLELLESPRKRFAVSDEICALTNCGMLMDVTFWEHGGHGEPRRTRRSLYLMSELIKIHEHSGQCKKEQTRSAYDQHRVSNRFTNLFSKPHFPEMMHMQVAEAKSLGTRR